MHVVESCLRRAMRRTNNLPLLLSNHENSFDLGSGVREMGEEVRTSEHWMFMISNLCVPVKQTVYLGLGVVVSFA